MGMLSRLFSNKKTSQPLPTDSVCFPLFIFDCRVISDSGVITYGDYARVQVARRLAALDPAAVADPNAGGYFGDLIYPDQLAKLFANEGLEVDLSLLARVAAERLRTGELGDSAFFLVGTGNLFNSAVELVHAGMSAAAVTGYVGASRFLALGAEDTASVVRMLSLVPGRWPRV